MTRPIKPKERETIIQSLKSGVVPRLGLQHIQVGRNEELKSFIKDIDTIADGGKVIFYHNHFLLLSKYYQSLPHFPYLHMMHHLN